MKKRIRVWCATQDIRTTVLFYLDYLKELFEFEEAPDNPDYVFASNMDRFYLKYTGVRIWLTGENLIPDFNIVDYAIGFNDINFGDRYLRWPIYCWGHTLAGFEKRRNLSLEKRPPTTRTKHSVCVVSNMSNRQGPFSEMLNALECYKGVTYGGKWRNNIGGRVKDKEALLREHKFSIAFENTSYPGYTTEKITDALMGGTIPIYWGDPDISQCFNSKAFVNISPFDTVESVMERIKRIDASPDVYESMLREPIFTKQAVTEMGQDRIIHFMEHIFSQPWELAFRRNRSRWGIKYENMLFRTYFNPFSQLFRLPKILWRRFRK